jgi:hypothetical protein
VFGRIIPEVVGNLDGLGVRRGMMVGWYADDMARNVTELQMPVARYTTEEVPRDER